MRPVQRAMGREGYATAIRGTGGMHLSAFIRRDQAKLESEWIPQPIFECGAQLISTRSGCKFLPCKVRQRHASLPKGPRSGGGVSRYREGDTPPSGLRPVQGRHGALLPPPLQGGLEATILRRSAIVFASLKPATYSDGQLAADSRNFINSRHLLRRSKRYPPRRRRVRCHHEPRSGVVAAKSRFDFVSVIPSRNAISSVEISGRSFRRSSAVQISDGGNRSKKTQGRMCKACPVLSTRS